MRRGNGTGSIIKVKGRNLRNPWRVRVTKGWEVNENGNVKQNNVTLGYYKTRTEAEEALSNYNKHPYDIAKQNTTFAEVYELWKDSYIQYFKNPESVRNIESAYNYCSGLWDMRIRDITIGHLRDCTEKGYRIIEYGEHKGEKRFASAGIKVNMKGLFNKMFLYAREHNLVDQNIAKDFVLDKHVQEEKKRVKKQKVPFTSAEIQVLWDNVGKVDYVDMVLIQIYGGWRPDECASLRLDDVHLDEDYLVGGMKTMAGTNRMVPIHSDIKGLVEKRYKYATALGSNTLFCDPERGLNKLSLDYNAFKVRFDNVMKELEMTHKPHECRHTFITAAKMSSVDQYLLKFMVGHRISDVTEEVYTHRDKLLLGQLKEEMKKIDFLNYDK